MCERTVGFGALAFGYFQAVAQVDRRDSEQLIVRFNSSLDIGFQVVCCGDSARFQRAGKCAGQSTSQSRNDVVNCRRDRFRVFYAIILCVSTVRSKMQWLREALDMRFSKGSFLLHQPDFRRVNDFTHLSPPLNRCFGAPAGFCQMKQRSFIVLD
jgi:hypothetical protein